MAAATLRRGAGKSPIALVALGLFGGAGFAWYQFKALSKNHADLQQRFDALEIVSPSTDESIKPVGRSPGSENQQTG